MAVLDVRCKCGKTIAVDAQHRGRTIKCKSCGRTMRIAGAPGAAPLDQVRALVPRERLAWLTPLRVWRTSLAYAAVVCAVAAALWGLGDAWWIGTILLFIGRWPFLIPLGLLVPAAIARDRRSLVPLAVAAVVCIGPVMGFRTGWRSWGDDAPANATPFRVVTFNANIGDAIAIRLPLLLDEWRADVVALQECGPVLAAAMAQERGWHSHQERGLCLLSRHPITDTAVMDRSAFARVEESADGSIGGAADVVRYRISTPAGDVHVTNLHLETPRKGLEGFLGGAFQVGKLRDNTTLRMFEAQRAREWAAGGAGSGPMIVAGDFNTPVESRIYRANWGSLTNAFSYAGAGLGATRLNGWIRVRIDHVLAGDGVVPVRVARGPETQSDHLPVVADFLIAR